jgi:hypothetical protein
MRVGIAVWLQKGNPTTLGPQQCIIFIFHINGTSWDCAVYKKTSLPTAGRESGYAFSPLMSVHRASGIRNREESTLAIG